MLYECIHNEYCALLVSSANELVWKCVSSGMLACPQVFDPEFRKGFPNVQRWYTTLTHFPHFSAVFQVKDLAKERLKGAALSFLMPVHMSGNSI